MLTRISACYPLIWQAGENILNANAGPCARIADRLKKYRQRFYVPHHITSRPHSRDSPISLLTYTEPPLGVRSVRTLSFSFSSDLLALSFVLRSPSLSLCKAQVALRLGLSSQNHPFYLRKRAAWTSNSLWVHVLYLRARWEYVRIFPSPLCSLCPDRFLHRYSSINHHTTIRRRSGLRLLKAGRGPASLIT